MDRVSERAAQAGIETHYIDAYGAARTVPAESLALILEAIGEPDLTRRLLPPASVVRHGRGLRVPLAGRAAGARGGVGRLQAARDTVRGAGAPDALHSELP